MRGGCRRRRKRICVVGRSRRSRPGIPRRRCPLCSVCHRRRCRGGSTRLTVRETVRCRPVGGAAAPASSRPSTRGSRPASGGRSCTRSPTRSRYPGWSGPARRSANSSGDWFGVGLSLVTIGKYLRSWGLSPQKPIRRAYEQNPEAVTHWLETEYPAIEARARKEKAIILWLDQTGLRSDAAVGHHLGAGRADPGGGQDRQTLRRQRDGRDQQQGRVVLHLLPRLVHRPGVPDLPRPADPPPSTGRSTSSSTGTPSTAGSTSGTGSPNTLTALRCTSCPATHPNSTP